MTSLGAEVYQGKLAQLSLHVSGVAVAFSGALADFVPAVRDAFEASPDANQLPPLTRAVVKNVLRHLSGQPQRGAPALVAPWPALLHRHVCQAGAPDIIGEGRGARVDGASD